MHTGTQHLLLRRLSPGFCKTDLTDPHQLARLPCQTGIKPSTVFRVHCGFKEKVQRGPDSQLHSQFPLCWCAGVSNPGHFVAAESITKNAISISGTWIFAGM